MPKQQSDADGQSRTAARSTKRKRKPFLLQRLRRQDIILLSGLLSLACFSVILVGLLIVRFQPARATPAVAPGAVPGPQPTHTVTFVQITGLSQYQLAEAEALAWSPDAQLVSANANWPDVLSEGQIGEPGQWTFRFYSPGRERLFIVKIEADGGLRGIEHIIRITLPPPVLGTGSWITDSPAALATWLDYGGAALIRRNPGLEVLIQLRHLDDQPNPVWLVIGTDKRTQEIHIVVVDTIDGTVVSTSSSE